MSEYTAMQAELREMAGRGSELEAAIRRVVNAWDDFVEILPSTFDESEMAEQIESLRRLVTP